MRQAKRANPLGSALGGFLPDSFETGFMVNRTANDRSAGVGGVFKRRVRKSPKESRTSVKCCSKGASRNTGQWDTVGAKKKCGPAK